MLYSEVTVVVCFILGLGYLIVCTLTRGEQKGCLHVLFNSLVYVFIVKLVMTCGHEHQLCTYVWSLYD